MSNPRVMILHAPGTNRDREAAVACKQAGGEPEIVHINQLLAQEFELAAFQMLLLPGGFSYGDDLGAGRLWANDLFHSFRKELDAFVEAGKPVIGICNGFQALVKAGYLPGPAPKQRITLTHNKCGHFECRWVRLRPNIKSQCVFTRDFEEDVYCPVAHGEGRIALLGSAELARLEENNLIALTYVSPKAAEDASNMSSEVSVYDDAGYPSNPNGSVADIAGITNTAGNVFGLMPHPEDHIFAEQHPRFGRGERGGLGIVLFENGVRAAQLFIG